MREHLRIQLGFLERSCASYDCGFRDESIRIAAVARILFHQTANSTSRLTHLNAGHIQLLSTTHDIGTVVPLWYSGMTRTAIGPAGLVLGPKLGDGSCNEQKPFDSWWSQMVMAVERVAISRRQVILAAANMDGGAHVDTKLTPEYERLMAPGAIGEFGFSDGSSEPVLDAHLLTLRQIGYEILNSTDLIQLANAS
jgi:hypothetical protein